MTRTRPGEPQNHRHIDLMRSMGPEVMGHGAGFTWRDDPRRLVFMLSRYKFVAKMLAGLEHVLEIGCADGFGTRLVAQAVGRVTGIDFDPDYIESAVATANPRFPIAFSVHDILAEPFPGRFDAVFALDVLEHVARSDADRFMANCIHGLPAHGVCIMGMPSLESQPHASEGARMGHVNCMTQPDFKTFMEGYFFNVFMFAMNDEVLHTGFSRMAHYNFALCCGRR
jgi:cyclopropane fatty-acyl-phospholipid synthase-like methyltransferase